MSTHRSSRVLLGLVGAATVAALVVPGAAFAKGTPGGGGGGGGGDETTANSLSVPAIFVGSNPFGLTCGALTGTAPEIAGVVPLDGYPDDPDLSYYVQGIHKWQAGCINGAATATAVASWGDNLTGDAKLKVGSPIRVEIGLNAGDQGMTGWLVEKLEEAALDREAPYGTQAEWVVDDDPETTDVVEGYWRSFPVTPFLFTNTETGDTDYETRVWDKDATLAIYPVGSPAAAKAATAEINATGRVVYGYNLRVQQAGDYVIEYTFPNVLITGSDAGVISHDGVVSDTGHTVTLEITVIGGGGGGGRR